MDFTKLDKYLADLPNHGIPACDMIITLDHKVLYRGMAGVSHQKTNTPVSATDQYKIFSNTKLMTVVATMQLVEKGLLSLDDKLSKYIPSYSKAYYIDNGDKVYTDDITIKMLLTMTAGLTYDVPNAVVEYSKTHKVNTTLDAVSALALEPLAFKPGTHWKYSRCHDVLGGVIEAITGISFDKYLEDNIWKPLGLMYTTFDTDSEYVKEHMCDFCEYDNTNHTSTVDYTNYLEGLRRNVSDNYMSGGGGLVSTTEDYSTFIDALCNGGVGKNGARIISQTSLNLIKQPMLTPTQREDFQKSHNKVGYSYGLGVRTLDDKSRGALSPIGEFGWDGMTGGYGLIDLDHHLSVCYMQNVYNCSYAWFTVFPDTRNMIYEILGLDK